MNHTDLLNQLIIKNKLKSYLEIGIGSGQNFTNVIAGIKIGVDPAPLFFKGVFQMTSDDFFAVDTNKQKYDLIFIDGDHTAEQVEKDFNNSLARLNENGFIMIHDCLPENEEGTIVPRQTKIWWGDVYKFAMTLGAYTGITFKTFNIDNGCCLVWKGHRNIPMVPIPTKIEQITWSSYTMMGKDLMNVTNDLTI